MVATHFRCNRTTNDILTTSRALRRAGGPAGCLSDSFRLDWFSWGRRFPTKQH
ncbi:hypothetical protein ETAA8_19530 [Anatilimnocola aggregata]|uniref:Uncharacterized protein n=1 Tax=Anatilimnocola aggregata TaxID=2528021 RepID=A0A517Y9G1_9BACT|nr:hypothetical protein ETAA8_19530 [Anatilimnocola aggregata]